MHKLISICIPTYNRGKILEESLVRMTSERLFVETDDIEILVADNASPDSTQEICERFASRFPTKFIYYRQKENLGPSLNMTTLMKMAKGEFIKFQNDNFYFIPNTFDQMYDVIRDAAKDKPVVFFGSRHVPYCQAGVFSFKSHDEMLELLSYYTTWLGGFGFWKTDRDRVLEIHEKYCDTLLPQVAILWALFDEKKLGIIDNRELLSDEHSVEIIKGGYNVAEVFGKVYLGMLREHMGEGRISKRAYEKEKKRTFHDIIFFKYNDFLRAHAFTKGHYFSHTVDFHRNVYYWASFLYWPLCKFVSLLPKRVRYISKDVFLKFKSFK